MEISKKSQQLIDAILQAGMNADIILDLKYRLLEEGFIAGYDTCRRDMVNHLMETNAPDFLEKIGKE